VRDLAGCVQFFFKHIHPIPCTIDPEVSKECQAQAFKVQSLVRMPIRKFSWTRRHLINARREALAMFYRKVLRPIVQVSRWPWYIWDVWSRPPSRWSHRTRRYIGIADPLRDPSVHILLELAEKATKLPGEMAECGVFQGHTAIVLGLFIREHCLDKKIYGLVSRDRKSSEQYTCFNRRYHAMKA
jgi:hypothetical protein